MTATMPDATLALAADTGTGTGTGTGASTSTSTSTSTWQLSRRFMLRVAGLPFSALEALRNPASVAWADEVLARERRLAEAGAALSDLLHAAISDNEDEADRRALLALRRQVFNTKPVKDPEAALRLPMPQSCRDALASWLGEHAAWQRLCAQGADIVGAEDAAVRETLRRLAVDPRLRQGLLLASPSLDAALDGFLAKPPGRLSKRDRRTQRALVEYLYKVAGKTSPFSSFTGVALGEFTDTAGTASGGGDAGISSPTVANDWTDHPRINVAVLARLADLIAADDTLRPDLPVTLTAGWYAEEDRLRYMRHTTVRGDDDATVSFDIVHDDLFFLRHGAALQGILDVLAGEPDLRYADFIRKLSAAVNAPEPDCDAYARRLMQLGLLRVPALRIDIHHHDPLRDLATRLLTLDRPWATALSKQLNGIAAHLDGFPGADLETRRDILHQLRTGFEQVHEALGAPEDTLPRTLVYEDVRAGQESVPDKREAWMSSFAEPLRTLSEILPLFDMVLAHRLVLRGFFLARHGAGGRCEDVAGFVRDFHEDIYDQYVRLTQDHRSFDEDGNYTRFENWLRQPEFDVLDAARSDFADHMREIVQDRVAEDEVVLSETVLAELAARIAPLTSRFRPEAHFLQVGQTDNGPIAALNRTFGGLYFPFSRFSHCFEDIGEEGLSGELRTTSRTTAPEGAVLAEVAGGIVGTNLNLHGRLTDYQIICPDERSSVPADAQLQMDDLYLEHDARTDRLMLRSRRLGNEVVPVYFGYLLPMVLPAIARFLLLFSPSSLARLDVWAGVPSSESPEGIRTRPRVRLGTLILARRQWTFPASALPAHRPGADATERLLAWRRWQHTHSLPDQVFARYDAEGERAKPALLDFTSTVSLGLLDAALKDGGLRLEEMSPTADQLTVASTSGSEASRHVAELAVETTIRRAHPTFPGGTS